MGVRTSGTAKKKLREILKRCQNLKKPMEIIATDMKNEIRGNFDGQHDYEGNTWKKSKRAINQGGKTLRDKSRLYNSFSTKTGKNFARVGTNVVYAKVLNQGAKKGSLWKGEYTVKAHTRKVKYKTKKGEWAKRKKRITVKSHRRKGQAPWGDIKAYRYMGINQEMKYRYTKFLNNYILKGELKL